MSTSDQNTGEDFAARLTERLPVDETSIGHAAALPDVTMLSRLANEFFRAQPAPAFPASVAPSMPDASYSGTAFETMLPQLGMPLPSVPAIPSAGKFPIAPDMPGMSSAVPELSSFHGAPGQVAPGQVSAFALLVPRPSHRDCCNMTPAAHPPRFPRLPSRFPCPSLTRPCSRLSRLVCLRSRPCPRCGPRTMPNQC